MCNKRFNKDNLVYDDNDNEVFTTDDDYNYWKTQQDNLTNPLSDDYCKYNNE